jgi:hypothetical protein
MHVREKGENMTRKRTHLLRAVLCLALLASTAHNVPAGAAQRPRFRLVTVDVPPQPVEVQTRRGSYTGVFQNIAQIGPNGRADGILEVSAPSGELLSFEVDAGYAYSPDGGRSVGFWLLLHAVGDSRRGPALAIVRPSAQSEPCRIYDILGTQVNTPLRVEAEGRIDIIRE